jgi:hypothetical protein
MVLSVVFTALLAQAAPTKTVKVIKSSGPAKARTQMSQAQLDAEARVEDQKLRCADDPAACAGASAPDKSKELSAKEDALRRKELELAEREEALRKKQEEDKDEKEKSEKARAEQKKHLEKQSKQLDSMMQGIGGALSGDE